MNTQVANDGRDLLDLARMCHLIGDLDHTELRRRQVSFPELSIQRLLIEGGYLRQRHVDSLELGQALIKNQTISDSQFCVAMFDEITTGIFMKESLQMRGWLPK